MYDIKLAEFEFLEKIFSIFHGSNIVMQQQCRQRQFKTYRELIFALLTIEQTNKLFLKNHNLRLAGTRAILEMNVNLSTNSDRNRGCEQRHMHGSCRSESKSSQSNKNNPRQKNAIAPKS